MFIKPRIGECMSAEFVDFCAGTHLGEITKKANHGANLGQLSSPIT